MLQQNSKPPPYTRLEWIGVIIAATFALGTLANLIGCHADELRECQEQRNVKCPIEIDVVLAEYESQLIAADLAGYERRMYEENADALDAGLQNRPREQMHGTAITPNDFSDIQGPEKPNGQESIGRKQATTKVWPQVLSVFTSTDPDKPDRLAGSSSAWPLPPGPVTLANMVSKGTPEKELPDGWARRRVRHTDFGVALRGVKRYTLAKVCQVIDGAECCATGPAITTGPFKALCRSPDDCAGGQECRRQIGDITRPGDKTEYWRTTQIGRDGPCEHRGAVDVTPAFRDVCGFRAMRPVTVRLL